MFDQVPAPVDGLMQAAINVLAWALPIVLAAIGGRIAIWFAARWRDFKLSQPENVQRVLEDAAKFGADFAEKVAPAMQLMGKEKMEAAIGAAMKLLAAKGYSVDSAPLYEMVEVILFNNPDKYPSSKG